MVTYLEVMQAGFKLAAPLTRGKGQRDRSHVQSRYVHFPIKGAVLYIDVSKSKVFLVYKSARYLHLARNS